MNTYQIIGMLFVVLLMFALFISKRIRQIDLESEAECDKLGEPEHEQEYTEYEQARDRILDLKEQDRIDELRGVE